MNFSIFVYNLKTSNDSTINFPIDKDEYDEIM